MSNPVVHEAVSDPVRRKLDPERTRLDILAAAHEEFVQHGLSGARMDAIAARTNTAKRMIYYYFGSKEELYLAVLEQAYSGIRTAEAALELDRMSPVEALRRMVEFTFDYHDSHPGFSRLVSVENINNGRFIGQSRVIAEIGSPVVDSLRRILRRGEAEGVFRAGLDAVDIHMMISALTFFRVSNRHTFGALFHQGLSAEVLRDRHRLFIADAVLRTVKG